MPDIGLYGDDDETQVFVELAPPVHVGVSDPIVGSGVVDLRVTIQPAPEVNVGIAPVGAQGPRGLSVLSGEGPPSNETGQNGEFYLDTDAQVLYGPKVDGDWDLGQGLIGAARTSVMFAREGLLAAAAGVFAWYAADDWRILSVRAKVTVPPEGSDIVLDVLRDGVSLWADPADRPRIVDGSDEVLVTVGDESLLSGQELAVRIDEVGSSLAGGNLLVQVDLEAAEATAIDLLTDDRLVVFMADPGQPLPGWDADYVTFQAGDGLSFVEVAPHGFVVQVERPGVFAVSVQLEATGEGWADVGLDHFGPAPDFESPADAVPMSSRGLVDASGAVLRVDETLRAVAGDLLKVTPFGSGGVSLEDLRIRVTRLR